MRAVLDPNVLVSALLSPAGPPAEIVRRLARGEFELIVSPRLLDELQRVLSYPKLRSRIDEKLASRAIEWLVRSAAQRPDPDEPPATRSADAYDDYLIALAEAERALLVSGDNDLLALEGQIPVVAPAAFLELL